jgi:uncharacterized protein YndB with AHSA1/START domain
MIEQIRQGDIPGVQLRYRHALPVEPAQVWQWLRQPDLLARWMADRAVATSSTADEITLETSRSGGVPLRERLAFVQADEPDLLVLDLQQIDAGWPVATRLTFEMLARDGGTEISVLQQGFAQLPLSDCLTIWEAYRRRWRSALPRLADRLTETP